MTSARERQEFRIIIDGISLPAKSVAKINEALQKAILAEMAVLDLRGNELVFSPIMARMVDDDRRRADTSKEGNGGGNGGGGGSGGAQIRVIAKAVE
ncbi:hypothetical protein BJN34_17115 [Cupriavidus necator]|uniref:Uncharacterized protein n=1 Tax=Cupriavidus necator TaxID=106590 RepID=A0A1U9USH6_CUPNE|nr:hypothetical protein [Cupriavidus necator]AQV95603.1 hypothetical protein BJN34_17115 [Cupriavidus necator]